MRGLVALPGSFRSTLGPAAAVALALTVCSLPPPHASANSIIPQPWQSLVGRADLVGIVECVTPGEITARYRVVDSWKGPPAGTELTMRGYASVYGAVIPIALYGEQYLVIAKRWRPEYKLSTGLSLARMPGAGLPQFWRDDRPDYFIPNIQCILPLPIRPTPGTHPLGSMSWYHADVESFRDDARALLALPEEEQEASVLRASFRWYTENKDLEGRFFLDSLTLQGLTAKMAGAGPDSIVSMLLDLAKRRGPVTEGGVHLILTGGGAWTLRYLSEYPIEEGVFSGSRSATLVRILRWHVGVDPPQDHDPLALPPKPSAEERKKLRELFSNPHVNDFRKAFETLAVHDPGFVVRFLVDWPADDADPENSDLAYSMGAFFAWRCQRDRARYLRMLTTAKNPYVRTAGALYLSFEDRKGGTQALTRLAALQGDAGAWAALNLARRGDKAAALRAMDVLRTQAGVGYHDQLHRNLQARLLVLLSNSALRSGVPQPGRWSRDMFYEHGGDQTQVAEHYLDWWRANEAKLTLYDPWLGELDRQKIE